MRAGLLLSVAVVWLSGCAQRSSLVGFWEATEPLRDGKGSLLLGGLTMAEDGRFYLVHRGMDGQYSTSCGTWKANDALHFVSLTDGLNTWPCTTDADVLQLPHGDQILCFERQYTAEQLIPMLESNDSGVRMAATRRLFAMGPAVAPLLQRAGAEYFTPHGKVPWRRIDAICTLLLGLRPNEPGAFAGYRAHSFGVMVDPATTDSQIGEIGQRRGFSPDTKLAFCGRGCSMCYVNLDEGRDLAATMREVLLTEAHVQSVCVNYCWGGANCWEVWDDLPKARATSDCP